MSRLQRTSRSGHYSFQSAPPIAMTLCFWISVGGVEPTKRQIIAQLADPHSQMNASMLNTIGGHDECHFCARSTTLPEFFPNAEIRMQNQTCSMVELEHVGALPLLCNELIIQPLH